MRGVAPAVDLAVGPLRRVAVVRPAWIARFPSFGLPETDSWALESPLWTMMLMPMISAWVSPRRGAGKCGRKIRSLRRGGRPASFAARKSCARLRSPYILRMFRRWN